MNEKSIQNIKSLEKYDLIDRIEDKSNIVLQRYWFYFKNKNIASIVAGPGIYKFEIALIINHKWRNAELYFRFRTERSC